MMQKEKRAKIIWHCRRGMLELDLLLERFVTNELDNLSPQQTAHLEELLQYPDPVLHALLMGEVTCEDSELNEFVKWMQVRSAIR